MHKRKRPSARAATADLPKGAAEVTDGKAPVARGRRSPADADKSGRRVSARAHESSPSEATKGSRPAQVRAAKAARPEDVALPTHGRATRDAEDELERDVQGLIGDLGSVDKDIDGRQRVTAAIGRIAARLHDGAAVADEADSDADASLLGGVRQLLSADHHVRQWARFGMRARAEQVDDFGLDSTYEAAVQPMLDVLYKRYFRVSVEGANNISDQGAALLVCNHSGALPWDGLMLKTAIAHAHAQSRRLRWLLDDFVFHTPFAGAWLNRMGAVRACPENAERLLERGELLAAFPEGVKGIGKTYRERHRLERFGRGGHIKLALRLQVPLIPVAIVGGEETYPLLYKVRTFSKLLGMPFIPITPLFPLLGPLGLVPLPSRWQIAIGEPMHELQGLGPRAASDTVLVNDLNERLRGRVQALLDGALAARGSNPFV
jgi:1-acyl-sn-glycerol-3-phosphate acyltransferase